MNKDLLKFIEGLTANDAKTLSQKALKLTEEVGELAKAILPFESAAGTLHRFVNKEKILDGVADTYLVALSIALSLGFSVEELEVMIQRKSLKWAGLQQKERAAKFPVPFEIHITVKNAEVNKFIEACQIIGAKPLLLDLQKSTGETALYDLMTSQIHVGDNTSAYNAMCQTSAGLAAHGFEVVREKIETVPWHPAAPSKFDAIVVMPPNSYFESHLAVVIPTYRLNALREHIKTFEGCHISKNIFKKLDDDFVKIMVTLRSYTSAYEDFQDRVKQCFNFIEDGGFKVEDPIVEFSIFDTKVSHDAEWIRK